MEKNWINRRGVEKDFKRFDKTVLSQFQAGLYE